MADSTVYSTAINPGAPPLRWDNVYEAFRQVNANFEMIEAALGSAGITPINFNDLDSGVSPADTNTFTLGTISKQWKSVHTAEWLDVAGSELNGLWAGNAHIKGIGYTIDLPVDSTVDGSLIIDPSKVWFNEIQIDNNESIVATDINDSFGILSGDGISLSVDSGSESLTITNTGILNVTAGAGISRTIVSGTANIVNTGVLTLANTGSIGTRTIGLGINVSSASGNPVITNTGVISISNGVGITVSLDAATGDVTISNSAPAVNAFAQIEVDGDSGNRLAADSVSDILNIVSGYGITLDKTVGTDTLTINVNPAHDIKGSVFADDSTVMVDAVSGIVPAEVVSGTFTGTVIGNVTGNLVGNTTGSHDGDVSGSVFADDSTMLVDGVGGQIVGPINSFDGVNSITMDTINGVIIGGTSGAQIIGAAGAQVYIGGGTSGSTSGNILLGNGTNRVLFVSNTIDTDDSSALIFEPPVTFNTDVTFENDITVAERLTLKGSRVINLSELQSVVAASSSFADFQTRIAALV